MADEQRDSKPGRREPFALLTEAQKAQQEAANTLLQYDRMVALIKGSISSAKPFRLRPHVIQDLNRLSTQKLEKDAGRWRDGPMDIGNSSHIPPSFDEVPRLIDEMCEYVNDNWFDRSAVHLAAYIMWRLNWIHPFDDGNGRTTRAISYYVLCARSGLHLPGVPTIPELIAKDKSRYYKALDSADKACRGGSLDVSAMEGLLGDLLAKQMVEAHHRAEDSTAAPTSTRSATTGSLRGYDTEAGSSSYDRRSAQKAPILIGVLTLLFFMALLGASLFGFVVPESAKWLASVVIAFGGAMSVGLLGGKAGARGSIQIAETSQGTLNFNLTGAIACFVVLLLLARKIL